MSSNELLDIKAQLINNNYCYYSGQSMKVELQFSNKSDQNVYFKDIVINFECHCSINLFHLKRFHKKNEVERILAYFNQRSSSNNNASANDNDQFLLLKSELIIFKNPILCAKDNYQTVIKIRIPDETVSTYKSKYIHFHNLIRIKTSQTNYEIKETFLPIIVKDHSLKEVCSMIDTEAEDLQINNPFEIKEDTLDDSIENELMSKLLLDKQSSTRYKVTYQNSELCYLTMLKSYVSLGDDVKIIINFVMNSSIRCVKFSVTLKAKENLLIPKMNTSQEELEVCLSVKEFGPYFHDSLCTEIYPVVVRMPNDQYQSLNFEFFKFQWYLDFKFMIANTTEVSFDIDEPPQTQVFSWSFKKDIKTELLKWELPICVYSQKISEI